MRGRELWVEMKAKLVFSLRRGDDFVFAREVEIDADFSDEDWEQVEIFRERMVYDHVRRNRRPGEWKRLIKENVTDEVFGVTLMPREHMQAWVASVVWFDHSDLHRTTNKRGKQFRAEWEEFYLDMVHGKYRPDKALCKESLARNLQRIGYRIGEEDASYKARCAIEKRKRIAARLKRAS